MSRRWTVNSLKYVLLSLCLIQSSPNPAGFEHRVPHVSHNSHSVWCRKAVSGSYVPLRSTVKVAFHMLAPANLGA